MIINNWEEFGKRVESANGLTGEVYTHLKIVFGENPKTILPEYNCNQDLVFWKAKNQTGFSIL